MKVFVGLSGGVDSSVAALLLKQQGYEVTGVFMKNWTQDLPGHLCPWLEDYQDAKRVAVQLGINFKVYDFQKDYRHRVVDYMLREYKAGRTPNPDVMCNQEIKFGLFFETALADGADLIATGHYARIANRKQQAGSSKGNSKLIPGSSLLAPRLLQARDANKDQTYFLYRATQKTLQKTLYPIGDYLKPEVRQIAAKHKLVTAKKDESMGLCFVGKVGVKDFLRQYVKTKPGKIIDQKGKVIGQHDGAIFYTIGQRHGLEVGGGLPYYVTGKDMEKNELYVTTNLQDEKLWSRQISLNNLSWINPLQGATLKKYNKNYSQILENLRIRIRHQAPLIPVKKFNMLSNFQAEVGLVDEVRALAPGQSAVFYSGRVCLGGGIVV